MLGDDAGEARRGVAASPIGRRIRSAYMRLGWSLGELARRAGVSRTTLYQLERGTTTRPQPQTLFKIATALGTTADKLDGAGGIFDPFSERGGNENLHRTFNRRTNTVISEVCKELPELFRCWSENEWDELYSTFGTGGQLTADGVRRVAGRINEKKRTIQRLQVVLETHYADVAASMIEAMYRAVRPGDNLMPSAELTALIAAHRADDRQSAGNDEQG